MSDPDHPSCNGHAFEPSFRDHMVATLVADFRQRLSDFGRLLSAIERANYRAQADPSQLQYDDDTLEQLGTDRNALTEEIEQSVQSHLRELDRLEDDAASYSPLELEDSFQNQEPPWRRILALRLKAKEFAERVLAPLEIEEEFGPDPDPPFEGVR